MRMRALDIKISPVDAILIYNILFDLNLILSDTENNFGK